LLKSGYPNLVTRYGRRISKKHKRPCKQRHVPDIHPRTTESLFPKKYCKSNCQTQHPDRKIRRHDQRNQSTTHQKSFFDRVTSAISKVKLDPQPDHVRPYEQRQQLSKTIRQLQMDTLQKSGVHPQRNKMLMSYIISSKDIT